MSLKAQIEAVSCKYPLQARSNRQMWAAQGKAHLYRFNSDARKCMLISVRAHTHTHTHTHSQVWL